MSGHPWKRVICLGIDGFDPAVAENLIHAGLLPNLRRVAESGSYARLETCNPAQSPVVWASLATGCNPGQHGIFDFLTRSSRDYSISLSLLRVRAHRFSAPEFSPPMAGQTFWDIAARFGVSCTILRWPVIFPPNQDGSRCLAGLGVPDVRGTLGRYTLFTLSPERYSRNPKGQITPLVKKDGMLVGELSGPLVATLAGSKSATLPVSLTILDADNVELFIGDQRLRLRKGEWSSWVKVQFKIGIGKHQSGMCRWYLLATGDDLALYVTPLQFAPDDAAIPLSWPPNYAAQLASKIGPFATLGFPEDTNAFDDGALDESGFLAQCDQVLEERQAMLHHELERFREGVLAIVFDTVDRVQHMFWNKRDDTLNSSMLLGASPIGEVITNYYKRLDGVVKEILAHVDAETLLLVCSDHGFQSFRRSVDVNSWLCQKGYLKLRSNVVQSGGLFEHVDWGRTQAYAVGFSSLYLNRKGRESEGAVSEEQVKNLKGAIAEGLRGLLDPGTGEPVVKQVYDGANIYHGPAAEDAPDLVMGFSRGYRIAWQSALGEVRNGNVIQNNSRRWAGDHCMDPSEVPGVLFASHEIGKSRVKALDLAPTILDALRIPIPTAMEGSVIW